MDLAATRAPPHAHARDTMSVPHLGPPEPPSLAELRGSYLQVDLTCAALKVRFLLHVLCYATLYITFTDMWTEVCQTPPPDKLAAWLKDESFDKLLLELGKGMYV